MSQPAAAGPEPAAVRLPARANEVTAADLVARVTAAGGTLRIANPGPRERAAWRRAIYAATSRGTLPAGMRLRYSGRGSGDLVLRLVPDIPANAPRPMEPDPVHVPARLVRPHPVVVELRQHPERLRLSAGVVQRALRILQALFAAAQKRGYRIEAGRREDDAVASIVVGTHRYPVILTEGRDRTPHVPTKAELADAARYSWSRPPEYDYHPSGELSLSLPAYWAADQQGRRHTWSDRTRWRLEDKLAHVLVEIAERAKLDEQRRLQREAEDRARRAAEHRALDRAWERLVAEHRARHLRRQMEALRLSDEIRTFCTTLRSASAPDGVGAVDENGEGWLSWAERYADAIDPRLRQPTMPVDPVPDLEALRLHMDGGRPPGWEAWSEWRRGIAAARPGRGADEDPFAARSRR